MLPLELLEKGLGLHIPLIAQWAAVALLFISIVVESLVVAIRRRRSSLPVPSSTKATRLYDIFGHVAIVLSLCSLFVYVAGYQRDSAGLDTDEPITREGWAVRATLIAWTLLTRYASVFHGVPKPLVGACLLIPTLLACTRYIVLVAVGTSDWTVESTGEDTGSNNSTGIHSPSDTKSSALTMEYLTILDCMTYGAQLLSFVGLVSWRWLLVGDIHRLFRTIPPLQSAAGVTHLLPCLSFRKVVSAVSGKTKRIWSWQCPRCGDDEEEEEENEGERTDQEEGNPTTLDDTLLLPSSLDVEQYKKDIETHWLQPIPTTPPPSGRGGQQQQGGGEGSVTATTALGSTASFTYQTRSESVLTETGFAREPTAASGKGEHRQDDVSLTQALFRMWRWPYAALGLVKIILLSIGSVMPLLMKGLVEALKNEPHNIRLSLSIVLLLLSLTTVQTFIQAHYDLAMRKIAMHSRGVLSVAIYRHVLARRRHELDQFTTGEVTNFMTVDAFRIADQIPNLNDLWALPLQTGLTLYLLYLQVSYAFLTGLGLALLLVPLNIWLAKKIGKVNVEMMKQNDIRVQRVSEAMRNIKTLKLIGWAPRLIPWIMEPRTAYMKCLRWVKLLDAWCVFFWATTPVFVSLLTFSTYVALGNTLSAGSAIAALALFNALIFPLNAYPWVINGAVELNVSRKRLSRFLKGFSFSEADRNPNMDTSSSPHPSPDASNNTHSCPRRSDGSSSCQVKPQTNLSKGSAPSTVVTTITRAGEDTAARILPTRKLRFDSPSPTRGRPAVEDRRPSGRSIGSTGTTGSSTTTTAQLENTFRVQQDVIVLPDKVVFVRDSTRKTDKGNDSTEKKNRRERAGSSGPTGTDSGESKERDPNSPNTEVPFRLRVRGSFRAEKGTLIGIVGGAASGKSTFLEGLTGEIPCHRMALGTSSRIQVTLEYNSYTPPEQIAYVPQEPFLVAGTVKENILFGLPHDSTRYAAALKAAALEDDLGQWPLGDETSVGDGGSKLSGGQKYRLALARAHYAQSDWYLLDDPLTALDPTIAAHIVAQYIIPLVEGGHGVILATHRREALQLADRIYLAEDGILRQLTLEEIGATTKEVFSPPPRWRGQERGQQEADETNTSEEESKEKEGDDDAKCNNDSNEKKKKKGDDEEMRAGGHGTISLKVLGAYVKHVGYLLAFVVFISVGLMQAARNGSDYYIAYAVDAEGGGGGAISGTGSSSTMSNTSNGNGLEPYALWNLTTTTAVSVGAAAMPTRFRDSYSLPTSPLLLSATYEEGDGGSAASPLLLLEPNSSSSRTGSSGHRVSDRRDQGDWDANRFLEVIGLLAAGNALIAIVRSFSFAFAGLRAARLFHDSLLSSIMNASFGFLSSVSPSQLINRLGKDVYNVDDPLPFIVNIVLAQLFLLIGSMVIVMISATWIIILTVFPLAGLYWLLQRPYRRVNREVKRLESAKRTPLIEHVRNFVEGGAVIRSFGLDTVTRSLEKSFQDLAQYQRAQFNLICLMAWFALRLQLLGTLILALVSSAAIFFRAEHATTGAAVVCLGVSYVSSLTGYLSGLWGAVTETEKLLISVERIDAFSHTPTEEEELLLRSRGTAKVTPTVIGRVFSSWPSEGRVRFSNVTLCYTSSSNSNSASLMFSAAPRGGRQPTPGSGSSRPPHQCHSVNRSNEESQPLLFSPSERSEDGKNLLSPSLSRLSSGAVVGLEEVSFALNPGERVAIVGRTGSGKTSLFNALLRLYPLTKGDITVDGVSITMIPPNELRQRIGILPQEPFLFKGTLRDNVDLFKEHSDRSVRCALNRVGEHLSLPLDFSVEESGKNLSAGQRQLVALARLFLPRSSTSGDCDGYRLLLMDEPSAMVDDATNKAIFSLLEEQFPQSTVLIITHRTAACTAAAATAGPLGEGGSPPPPRTVTVDRYYTKVLHMSQGRLLSLSEPDTCASFASGGEDFTVSPIAHHNESVVSSTTGSSARSVDPNTATVSCSSSSSSSSEPSDGGDYCGPPSHRSAGTATPPPPC